MADGARIQHKIASVLEEEIRKSLEASGAALPAFNGNRRLWASALASLDSLCGVEITVELEGRLGVKLEDNLFLKTVDGRPKRRTFDEIVQALVAAKE